MNIQESINKLQGKVPAAVLAEVANIKEITSNLRLAHFLAQCAHESADFTAIRENLNYSAQALHSVFGKYFPGTLNESYARQPEKIANRVYASRMGNGAENTGEGYKFRGRGYIQLTGKVNYQAFSKFINEDCVANPELVATKYPLTSAAYFFNSKNLWSVCDQGADEATVTKVTKLVNGGTNGLDDRLAHFNKYYKILA